MDGRETGRTGDTAFVYRCHGVFFQCPTRVSMSRNVFKCHVSVLQSICSMSESLFSMSGRAVPVARLLMPAIKEGGIGKDDLHSIGTAAKPINAFSGGMLDLLSGHFLRSKRDCRLAKFDRKNFLSAQHSLFNWPGPLGKIGSCRDWKARGSAESTHAACLQCRQHRLSAHGASP